MEADPDFAYGVMLTSLFQPNPQAMETFVKAQALAEKASPEERQYIQAMLHTRKGEIDQAIAIFDAAEERAPGSIAFPSHSGRIFSYLYEGNVDSALGRSPSRSRP